MNLCTSLTAVLVFYGFEIIDLYKLNSDMHTVVYDTFLFVYIVSHFMQIGELLLRVDQVFSGGRETRRRRG